MMSWSWKSNAPAAGYFYPAAPIWTGSTPLGWELVQSGGQEALAYRAEVTPEEIRLAERLDVVVT